MMCPDCGQLLHKFLFHGQRFFKCNNKLKCGSAFADDHGRPGRKLGEMELAHQPAKAASQEGANGKAAASPAGGGLGQDRHLCPNCQKPMTLLTRFNVSEVWSCVNIRKCGTRILVEADGQRIQRELTKERCPSCDHRLWAIYKSDMSVDHWLCPDKKKCGDAFADDGGKPGAKMPTRASCPDCGGPMKRCKSNDDAKAFDFWACQEPTCQARYNADAAGGLGNQFALPIGRIKAKAEAAEAAGNG